MPDMLTVDQVSRALNVSLATVRRLLAKGEIPGRRVGNQWRIPADDFERYIRGTDKTE